MLFQSFTYGQRSTRKLHLSTTINYPDSFAGRFFNVILINSDTVPFLLRLGPSKKIKNNDTYDLARAYTCNNPLGREYYDLDNLVSEENNCVRWYTLQLIIPKDSLHFVVKLKDFDQLDTARLYFCFTKEITKVDRELDMYADPKKIVMMKDGRDFKSNYVSIHKNTLTVVLQIGRQTE